MFNDRSETMSFHVNVTPDGTGTRVVSQIDTYRTKQEKLFMLIPIFPAEMVSWPVYKSFMVTMRDAFLAKDGAAQAQVVERV